MLPAVTGSACAEKAARHFGVGPGSSQLAIAGLRRIEVDVQDPRRRIVLRLAVEDDLSLSLVAIELPVSLMHAIAAHDRRIWVSLPTSSSGTTRRMVSSPRRAPSNRRPRLCASGLGTREVKAGRAPLCREIRIVDPRVTTVAPLGVGSRRRSQHSPPE